MRRALPLIVLSIAIAALVVAARLIQVSFDPAQYVHHAPEELADWTHPSGPVALFAGFVLAEAAVACSSLWFAGQERLWRGALSALALLALWSVFPLMFAMHAPGFMLVHHNWLLLLMCGLAIITVASGLAHAVTLLRARSTNAQP